MRDDKTSPAWPSPTAELIDRSRELLAESRAVVAELLRRTADGRRAREVAREARGESPRRADARAAGR
jgi:hypothetical protein